MLLLQKDHQHAIALDSLDHSLSLTPPAGVGVAMIMLTLSQVQALEIKLAQITAPLLYSIGAMVQTRLDLHQGLALM